MSEQAKRPKRKPLDLNRRSMPKQPPKIRSHNFYEVALGYQVESAVEEADRCIQCPKPKCVDNCPVEIDIPGFIKCIAERRFEDGVKILKEKNCLPAICGRVCPQEEQCEETCVLSKKKGQIAIGRLERFLADWEARQGKLKLLKRKKKTGKKVAVVGGGPAGLTVAGDLIQLGHEVTIFEALHKMGGVLTTVDSLLKEYDAIFVGTGAGLPWFMDIPGENLNGVYSANEYLTRMNLMKGYLFPEFDTPIKNHRQMAVIGGGNVAMDCARTALRLGAETRIIYRRSRDELPARLEEVENAEEEGVIFEFLTLPLKYIGDENGWVREIECLRMELGEPDASGRRRPVPIKGSEFRFQVDGAVCAIGNSPNPLILSTTPGLEAGKKGNIVADEANGLTSRERIWAGGDVVTGAATVILAMGAGRQAAKSIHEYLTSH